MAAAALFYLTAFGYVLNAGLLYLIHLETVEGQRKKTSMLVDMREGVKLILRNPLFGALIAITYCSQFFGWSFQSLFPVFAKDVFHGGAFELGALYSALGAGSLLGATFASNLGSFGHRGWLITGGFLLQAGLMLPVSVSPWFWLCVAFLLVLGTSQAGFNVTAQSTLQYLVPNEYRGRVMGVWGMTNTAVQPLGQLQMGILASATSAPIAVAVGGAAMLAFGLLWVLPNRHLRGLTPQEAGEIVTPRH